MKKRFSTKGRTIRIVQIETGGVFTHGDPDPTRLEISVLDGQGSLHVLVFERDTLGRLAGIIHGLAEAFPAVFAPRRP